MRYWLFAIGCLSIFRFSVASSLEERVEELIALTAPSELTESERQEAKDELLTHFTECGEGVVDSPFILNNENRCSYQIELDDLFFQSKVSKTGFQYDDSWPYEEGVQFMEPTAREMALVPQSWDLSRTGPMIRIFRQRCGDCWAQASRANLEQLIATFDGVQTPLSTQTLISSCCNTGDCSGGYMSTPGWIVQHGLPLESQDPYLGSNSRCKFNPSELNFENKLMQSPWVGNSRNYSRFFRADKRMGPKVKEIQAMMMRYKSSAVATILAIDQSGGIIDSCSAINSRGNHMQDIVGWYANPKDPSDVIARLQNSWGTGHGQGGYTHLKWECGEGRFNRGLGVAVRVGIYALRREAIPDAYTGGTKTFNTTKRGVILGREATNGQKCVWSPATDLTYLSSDHCMVRAEPRLSTEYHLTAETKHGKATAMVLVKTVDGKNRRLGNQLRTPFGTVNVLRNSKWWK